MSIAQVDDGRGLFVSPEAKEARQAGKKNTSGWKVVAWENSLLRVKDDSELQLWLQIISILSQSGLETFFFWKTSAKNLT